MRQVEQVGSVATEAMPHGAVSHERGAVTDARAERFRRFAERHRERSLRLAWRLVGADMAAAEDVTQDAFVRAWRALPRFREEAGLETWFYRILVRQASNHRRWRDVRERFGASHDVETLSRQQPDSDPALRDRIRRALDRLSRRQREVFVLVHLEGFTVREAAGMIGRSEGTLKSHLNRALVALRRELGDLAPRAGVAP